MCGVIEIDIALRCHLHAIDPLSVSVAPQGLFEQWLAMTGKLGGQRKVPRLCNDRRFLDPMLKLIQNR